jgi:hypothetical protein
MSVPEWADPGVAVVELDAQGVSRRGILRNAGLFGAAFAGAALAGSGTVAEAAVIDGDDPEVVYLVGDHHVHSVYSYDAKYPFSEQVHRASQFGLDWIVLTEHSNPGHANAGGAVKENAEVAKARAENPRILVFQGLEWYIPAAEHGTVFTAPGPNEAEVLRQFELAFDGKLLGRTAPTVDNENLAVQGIAWLGQQKKSGFVPDALVFANHPSRLGIDSPHEIRNWLEADPDIMIGMEGAPGAQGAALPGWRGSNSIRGEYENKPSENSWAAYPAEAYVTYGGFDWMTATVGGLWDSLLSEGRLVSVTTNSDNHRTVYDTLANGVWPAGQTFENTGKLPDPVETGKPQPGSDFWPGQFSRTHVGVTKYGYLELMAGLRAGRVWVDHGQLVDGLDVRVSRHAHSGRGVTLGGHLLVRKGESVVVRVTVTSATRPNYHGEIPKLAHIDVIQGSVRGVAADRDSWRAPNTRVVSTVDTSGRTGTYTVDIKLDKVTESSYIRLRGSDGNRHGIGLLGETIDPHGPIAHTPGDGDPWVDTWLYTNPIFIDVK